PRRPRSADISRLQNRDRKVLEQRGERHFRSPGCAADAFHGIALDMKRAVENFRAGPDPATFRQRTKFSCHGGYHGMTTMAACKGDHMIAVRSADLQRLVIAKRERLGKLGPQFQQMPSPGE